MHTVEEMRAINLQRIKRERFKTIRAMASVLDIAESRLSLLLRGPDKKALGSTLARRFEDKLGLDSNYLDNNHNHSHKPEPEPQIGDETKQAKLSSEKKAAKLLSLIATSNVDIDAVISIVETLTVI